MLCCPIGASPCICFPVTGKRKAEDLEGGPDCVCGAGPCAKHFSIKPRSKGRPFWRCPAQVWPCQDAAFNLHWPTWPTLKPGSTTCNTVQLMYITDTAAAARSCHNLPAAPGLSHPGICSLQLLQRTLTWVLELQQGPALLQACTEQHPHIEVWCPSSANCGQHPMSNADLRQSLM